MTGVTKELVISGERRWGQGSIDLRERTLPSLKAERVLRALEGVAPDSRVLDYGCGEGKLLYTLKNYLPNIKLFGVDIQSPLEKPRFEFALIENETCAFFGAKFDAILSVDVLEHVPELEAALQRLSSMLASDGRLVLFVPMEGEPLSPFGFFRWILGADIYIRTKSHVNAYRRTAFLSLVKRYFEVEEITYSYHALGTLLDSTFFALTSFKGLAKWFWKENSIYHTQNKKRGFLNRLLEVANWLCYFESTIFAKVPLFASGLHIKARALSSSKSKLD